MDESPVSSQCSGSQCSEAFKRPAQRVFISNRISKVTHHPDFPWGVLMIGGENYFLCYIYLFLLNSLPPSPPLLAAFQLLIQNPDMCVLRVGLLEYIIRCNRILVCTSRLERARMSNFQILGLYKLFFLLLSSSFLGGELSTSSTLSRFLWFLL